ncbi:MAG: leucine-rich repeat domain-containing protein [Promethearchaeota archaeon]
MKGHETTGKEMTRGVTTTRGPRASLGGRFWVEFKPARSGGSAGKASLIVIEAGEGGDVVREVELDGLVGRNFEVGAGGRGLASNLTREAVVAIARAVHELDDSWLAGDGFHLLVRLAEEGDGARPDVNLRLEEKAVLVGLHEIHGVRLDPVDRVFTKTTGFVERGGKLVGLGINRRALGHFPKFLAKLENLRRLSLTRTEISEVPPEIGCLESLEYLNLHGNELTSFPAGVLDLENLRTLDLTANHIREIPPGIARLRDLKVLKFWGNPLESFRWPRAKLPWKDKLRLKLKSLFPDIDSPREAFAVYLLEKLLRSKLARSRDWLIEASGGSVRSVFLKESELERVPDLIGEFRELEELHVKSYRLSGVTPTLAKLEKLRVLALGPSIVPLPREMGDSWLFRRWFPDVVAPVDRLALGTFKVLECFSKWMRWLSSNTPKKKNIVFSNGRITGVELSVKMGQFGACFQVFRQLDALQKLGLHLDGGYSEKFLAIHLEGARFENLVEFSLEVEGGDTTVELDGTLRNLSKLEKLRVNASKIVFTDDFSIPDSLVEVSLSVASVQGFPREIWRRGLQPPAISCPEVSNSEESEFLFLLSVLNGGHVEPFDGETPEVRVVDGRIRELSLSGARISLSHLKKLQFLEILRLRDCKLAPKTGVGAEGGAAPEIPNLRSLEIVVTSPSQSDCLKELARCKLKGLEEATLVFTKNACITRCTHTIEVSRSRGSFKVRPEGKPEPGNYSYYHGNYYRDLWKDFVHFSAELVPGLSSISFQDMSLHDEDVSRLLSCFPDSSELKSLDLSGNELKSFPPGDFDPSSLVELDLSRNPLESLGASGGEHAFDKLKRLNLRGTDILSIERPDVMFPRLEEVTLPDGSHFKASGPEIFQAFSGQPFVPDWFYDAVSTLLVKKGAIPKGGAIPDEFLQHAKWVFQFLTEDRRKSSYYSHRLDKASLERELKKVEVEGEHVTVLSFESWHLPQLPPQVRRLGRLRELNLSANKLAELPSWVGEFSELEVLDLSNNPIREFPECLFGLRKLRVLKLASTGLEELPDDIEKLGALEQLDLSYTRLRGWPGCLVRLEKLAKIEIPPSVYPELNLQNARKHLREFTPRCIVDGKPRTGLLRSWFKYFRGVFRSRAYAARRSLQLCYYRNKFKYKHVLNKSTALMEEALQLFSREIRGALSPGERAFLDGLEASGVECSFILDDSSGGRIAVSGFEISRLDLSNAGLKRLPRGLGELRGLKHLDLSWNELSGLPRGVAGLRGLDGVKIDGNPLKRFPKDPRVELPERFEGVVDERDLLTLYNLEHLLRREVPCLGGVVDEKGWPGCSGFTLEEGRVKELWLAGVEIHRPPPYFRMPWLEVVGIRRANFGGQFASILAGQESLEVVQLDGATAGATYKYSMGKAKGKRRARPVKVFSNWRVDSTNWPPGLVLNRVYSPSLEIPEGEGADCTFLVAAGTQVVDPDWPEMFQKLDPLEAAAARVLVAYPKDIAVSMAAKRGPRHVTEMRLEYLVEDFPFQEVFRHFPALEVLTLCGAAHLPRTLKYLTRLKSLTIESDAQVGTPLRCEFPPLPSLRELHLRGCLLQDFPGSLGGLPALRVLDLSSNEVGTISRSDTLPPKLEVLKLRDNGLTRTPRAVLEHPRLRELHLAEDSLVSIPKRLGRMPNLEKLVLSVDGWGFLPREIGELRYLKLLDLKLGAARGGGSTGRADRLVHGIPAWIVAWLRELCQRGCWVVIRAPNLDAKGMNELKMKLRFVERLKELKICAS